MIDFFLLSCRQMLLMNRYIFIVFSFFVSGCGCLAVPYVSEIGMKDQKGQLHAPKNESDIRFDLKVAGMKANTDLFGFTENGYYSDNNYIHYAEVSVNLEDIVWESDDYGKVSLMVDGSLQEFSVFNSFGELELQREYRAWYGYPAQGLMVVAYPLDASLAVVSGVASLTIISIMLIGNHIY